MRLSYTKLSLALALGGIIAFSATLPFHSGSGAHVMMLSLDTDGRHALTSHRDGQLVLWDINNKQRQTLAENANVYSAHFISDEAVLWQDTNNTVWIESLAGETITTFEAPAGYGNVYTADGTYIAADADWNIWLNNTEESEYLKDDGTSPSFYGSGKLLNLQLSHDETLLLSVGQVYGKNVQDGIPLDEPALVPDRIFSDHGGLVLWDLNSRLPIYRFRANASKTHATLSPDGQYVVAVDENSLHNIWLTDTGQRAYNVAFNFAFGRRIEGPKPGSTQWDNSGARFDYPDDLPDGFRGGSMVAVQFISDTEYLTFYRNQPYAVLYELGDPFALNILELGERPFPAVSNYSRNAAIATAPEANMLVTGHRDGDGITVYRYDPETRSLAREWVGR